LNKFWKFKNIKNKGVNESELYLTEYIAEESWFMDDVTPEKFKAELSQCSGDLTVYINSPGGDCFAASEIYTALMEYDGKITVKIESLAASAASVVAMAGDSVEMSPTSLMMIHNPSVYLYGEVADLEQGIEFLNEVKESIVNAYQLKTGLSRAKISKLMDTETWLSAKTAQDLGFADKMLYEDCKKKLETNDSGGFESFNKQASVTNTIAAMRKKLKPIPQNTDDGIKISDAMSRLKLAGGTFK